MPDLAVYSKALGNGYSISACRRQSLRMLSEVFLTGSSAMVAALQSLKLSAEKNVARSVLDKGKIFCEGLEMAARKYDFEFYMTGPTSMPYPWFQGDEDLYLIQKFCEIAASEGLFYHPHHNWFISDAHSTESLRSAVSETEKVFCRLREFI